jgi:RNA polymerase sigma-70 factor (ECF subfamily)
MRPIITDGDESAFELLFTDIFKEHEYTLYMLALRMTKSDQQAKDIIQEVFLKLWECRHSIQNIENIEAWLYRITENKVIDHLRKTAADGRLKDAAWNAMQQMLNETEALISAKEYNQIIRKAIDRLPPQRKLIYQMNKDGELSYQQIADELKISRHTVKNQLSTAIQSIRSFFTKTVKIFF